MNWAQQHATIFGHRSEEWVKTYTRWESLWIAEGYTMDDLGEAVVALSRRKIIPQFVSQHFAAMVEELREAKVVKLKRAVKPDDTRGVCVYCGDTGHIIVPHRVSMVGGRWTRNIPPHQGYTMAVICDRCRIGTHRKLRGQRLGEYETQFPDWRDEMDQWTKISNLRGSVDAFNRFSMRGAMDTVTKTIGEKTHGT